MLTPLSQMIDNTFIYYFGGPVQDAMRSNFADYVKAEVLSGNLSFASHNNFFIAGGITSQNNLLSVVNSPSFNNHNLFNFVR